MEEFIRNFGYIALTTGTFLEGETAIIFASSLIHSGVFNLFPTIFFAFLGSFISDWVYFLIGKANGKFFVERRPKLKAKLAPLTSFFENNQLQILFTYRFLYGFRVLIPIIIGMSKIKPGHYFLYSIVSGVMWATVITTIGYWIGRSFGLSLEQIQDNIIVIVLFFAGFGFVLGCIVKRIVGKS